MLERRHLAVLHIAKKELALDDDTYRDILLAQAGVRSGRDLDAAGFERVMEYFKRLGFKSRRQRSRAADEDFWVANSVTGRQQRYIIFLMHAVGFDDTKRQVGFCQRQIKRNWPQSREDANRIIESLKRMKDRGWKAPPQADSGTSDRPNTDESGR